MAEKRVSDKQLEECRKKAEEYLQGWQRERADFLNYKREAKEYAERSVRSAKADLLSDLFPVLDNLDRAERALSEEQAADSVVKGMLQIGKQLREFLSGQGVQELNPEGKSFDPEFHEAVGEAKGGNKGTVVEVVEKGYLLDGKLLRPAKVKVAA